jgi:hypothetical protein
MVRMWLFWLKHRWRQAGAAVAAVLAVLLVLLLALGRSGMGVSFLGDVSAPRLAAASGPSGVVLPRSGDPNGPSSSDAAPVRQSSILDKPLLANVGPQTVAEAQAAWSADEIAQHQREVLAAVNCARQKQGQGVLMLDPMLSQVAGDAWLKLARDPSWTLLRLPGTYALRGVLALDLTSPAQAAVQAQPSLAGQAALEANCVVGGFDPMTLTPSANAHAIGIAIFPPQVSWDMASAVILVK